jgi:hypothetical protein
MRKNYPNRLFFSKVVAIPLHLAGAKNSFSPCIADYCVKVKAACYGEMTLQVS